jgi:hypothetical protein
LGLGVAAGVGVGVQVRVQVRVRIRSLRARARVRLDVRVSVGESARLRARARVRGRVRERGRVGEAKAEAARLQQSRDRSERGRGSGLASPARPAVPLRVLGGERPAVGAPLARFVSHAHAPPTELGKQCVGVGIALRALRRQPFGHGRGDLSRLSVGERRRAAGRARVRRVPIDLGLGRLLLRGLPPGILLTRVSRGLLAAVSVRPLPLTASAHKPGLRVVVHCDAQLAQALQHPVGTAEVTGPAKLGPLLEEVLHLRHVDKCHASSVPVVRGRTTTEGQAERASKRRHHRAVVGGPLRSG